MLGKKEFETMRFSSSLVQELRGHFRAVNIAHLDVPMCDHEAQIEHCMMEYLANLRVSQQGACPPRRGITNLNHCCSDA
jgi:hypothetical protein